VTWRKPTRAEVLRAVEIYLSVAYPDEPPSAVRARLDTLRSIPDEDFYESAVLEHERVVRPSVYKLRMGNPFYPHMRMIIERAPDGRGYLFRVDTHDKHCVPAAQSRDYNSFCKLMERNQLLAQQIEAAWADAGIPTFQGFVSTDLTRRTVQEQSA
jgi:hypothetical protein